MRYIANPVEADAFKILSAEELHGDVDRSRPYKLTIGDGISDNQIVTATPEMTSRMTPEVGDYWVIQEDGYVYLNPKDVFERKYRVKEPQ